MYINENALGSQRKFRECGYNSQKVTVWYALKTGLNVTVNVNLYISMILQLNDINVEELHFNNKAQNDTHAPQSIY